MLKNYLISVVIINDDGDESEVHYLLSKDESKRMIDKYSLDGFIELLKSKGAIKDILDFLKQEKVLLNIKGY